MNILNSKLTSDPKVQLTDYELIDCIFDFKKQTFDDLKSLNLFYFTEGIKNEIIDPNLLLSICINKLDNSDTEFYYRLICSIIPSSNPNIYLKSKYGNIHVIIYIVLSMRESKIDTSKIDFLIYCFMIFGSNLTQNSFIQENIESEIKPNIDNNFISKITGENEGIKTTYKTISIVDWLYQNGLGQFKTVVSGHEINNLNIDNLIFKNPNIKTSFKKNLAIVCDNAEFSLNIVDTEFLDLNKISSTCYHLYCL
jgi:hypothetical protein